MAEPTPPEPRKAAGPGAGDVARWYGLIGLGFEFIAGVLLFGAIGWWLDRRFHSSPWLLIVGVGLGFAAGMFRLVRTARESFK